ncbi:MAG: oligosaccharide flippase family protein, partial [Patescibacteria group bacterium]
YGIYKYVLSMASILSIPTLSGMTTALAQSVARGYDGSFMIATKARIKWGLIGALASLILASYYFYNDNITLTFSFLISAVFLPFMDSLNSYEAVLVGKKMFKDNTKYNIIIKIIATIITISALYLTNNLFILIFCYFITYTVLRFIFLLVAKKQTKLNNQIDPQTVSYGKHLSLMTVIEIIASQLDKILVFNRLGAIELGIYSFAIAMPEQIKGLLKNIQSLALPKFAQSQYIENRKTMVIKMFKLSLLVLPIIIIYIIIAPYIFKIFFPQYLDAVLYSQIFSISLITISASLPVTFLQSQSDTKKLWQINLLSPIIQIVILVLAIYFYGLIGMVSARIINRFLNLFIVTAAIKNQ